MYTLYNNNWNFHHVIMLGKNFKYLNYIFLNQYIQAKKSYLLMRYYISSVNISIHCVMFKLC